MAALTVTELRHRHDDLIRLRADGLRVLVDQSGERVEFKSDSELARAIASLDAEIGRMTGNRPHTILFRTSKGLD